MNIPTKINPKLQQWFQKPKSLLIGFTITHLIFLITLLPQLLTAQTFGDLDIYKYWATNTLNNTEIVGINTNWVYPIGAIIPITLPLIFGQTGYIYIWLLTIFALNATAILYLTNFGKNTTKFKAAWWFLIFALIMHDVLLSRLEGITLPLAVIALSYTSTKPKLSTFLLTIATWIKVWPAAIILPLLIVHSKRILLATTAAITSATIITLTALAGGTNYIFSFILEQNNRGLQLEAPITTFWLWSIVFNTSPSYIEYNQDIKTVEVYGPNTQYLAQLMTPIMLIAVIAIIILITKKTLQKANQQQILLTGSLTLLTAFIFFNKVGSPQFILWLAPPVIIALGTKQWQQWKTPATLLLATALLTYLVFPTFYTELIQANPYVIIIITIRNLLELAILIWGIKTLHKLPTKQPQTL